MIKHHKYLYRFVSAALALTVCAAFSACSRTVSPGEPPDANLVIIEDQEIPLAASTKVLSPEASGKSTKSEGGATLDYSNNSEGYVMVKASGSGKTKVQITKQGKKTYTFDLSPDGKYAVFPLTGGDGNYTISVFKQVSGNQYAQMLNTAISVKLRDQSLPFLYPNQLVNFTSKSNAVAKGEALAKSANSQLGVVENVYNFVVDNLTYDTQKAKTVSSGYLPNVDSVLASKKGICFDYASLMAAMLRSQGIPTRLEVGYVSGGTYHSWISVYINGVGWVDNLIYFDGKNWKMMDPTFASSGKQNSDVMKFIGDGKNYSMQYVY